MATPGGLLASLNDSSRVGEGVYQTNGSIHPFGGGGLNDTTNRTGSDDDDMAAGLLGNRTVYQPPSTPSFAQAIIITMYTAVIILAVGGNLIICYIVLAYQRMRTVTNYFIVNLACSDILMSVLCIPFTFVANVLVQYWPFGAVMCPLVTCIQTVAVFLSAFTLVAISLDRYRAILFPLRPRLTVRQAVVIITLIWALSIAVTLPIAILSRQRVTQGRADCVEGWPDARQRYVYTLILMVLQYFLPLFVLMFTYVSIAIVIWGKKIPGEAENSRDQRIAASKRKMVKMMITVVIIYALCWLPLHIITLVGERHEEIYGYRHIQVVWTACHWLAMSNSCYNPIVYCWMNSKFRQGFRYVMRWCPCVRAPGDCAGPDVTARYHTHVSTFRSSTRPGARGGVAGGLGGGGLGGGGSVSGLGASDSPCPSPALLPRHRAAGGGTLCEAMPLRPPENGLVNGARRGQAARGGKENPGGGWRGSRGAGITPGPERQPLTPHPGKDFD